MNAGATPRVNAMGQAGRHLSGGPDDSGTRVTPVSWAAVHRPTSKCSPRGVSITDARIPSTLPQLVGSKLPLRPRRMHLTDEAVDLGGELGVSLADEDVAGGAPA